MASSGIARPLDRPFGSTARYSALVFFLGVATACVDTGSDTPPHDAGSDSGPHDDAGTIDDHRDAAQTDPGDAGDPLDGGTSDSQASDGQLSEGATGRADAGEAGSARDSAVDSGSSATAFTLAVLPDTQSYLPDRPEVFDAQTAWLADNAARLNLRIAVHVGDVVNYSWDETSWLLARDSMAILEGTVPYIIAPGNHDYGATEDVENAKDRSTLLHAYFPRPLFEAMPTFGGFWRVGERVDNSFHTFEVAGENWVVVALEFGPRQEAVDWANRVLDDHADHHALLATHAYLYVDGQRYDWAGLGETQSWNPHRYGLAQDGDVHDGRELWRDIVSKHPNIVAVLCGHAHGNGSTSPANNGVARLDSTRLGDPSTPVVQMLANYQDQPEGGGGFLRLLTVDPQARTVAVSTYSPYFDQYKSDEENAFRFDY